MDFLLKRVLVFVAAVPIVYTAILLSPVTVSLVLSVYLVEDIIR